MKVYCYSFACVLITALLFSLNLNGAEMIGKVALKSSQGNYIGRSGSQDVQAYHGSINANSTFELYAVDSGLSNLLKSSQLVNQVKILSDQVSLLKKEVESLRSWVFLDPPPQREES